MSEDEPVTLAYIGVATTLFAGGDARGVDPGQSSPQHMEISNYVGHLHFSAQTSTSTPIGWVSKKMPLTTLPTTNLVVNGYMLQ